MLSIDRETFGDIFNKVWWAFMNYECPTEKIEVYYKKLKWCDPKLLDKSANMLMDNHPHFPTIEEWIANYYSHKKIQDQIDSRIPEATPRLIALKDIMLPYFSGRATAQETYAKLSDFLDEHGGSILDFEWLSKKSGYLWGKRAERDKHKNDPKLRGGSFEKL